MRMAYGILSLLLAASLGGPAFADDDFASMKPRTVTLDINGDGRMDLAALEPDADPGKLNLSIYLSTGSGIKPGPASKPDFIKRHIAEGMIAGLDAKGKGSLVLTTCTGCGASKSTEETLTIVYRHGRLMVAGYRRSWDWNSQLANGTVDTKLGGCDINFLTGRGLVQTGTDTEKPAGRKFRPIRLDHWSEHTHPVICNF